MSLIPSKRVDRIFPIVPPLCLLLGAQIAAAHERAWVRRWWPRTLLFAVVFTAGYVALKIGGAERENAGALVRFGREVRQKAEQQHWRYEVVGGHEEGLLLYLRRDNFLPPQEAARLWQAGALDALVLSRENSRAQWPGAQEALVSEKSGAVPRYVLLVRSAPRENLTRQPDTGR
jgi:hypothetical protein